MTNYYFLKNLMKNINQVTQKLVKQLKIIQNLKMKKLYLIYLKLLKVKDENYLEELIWRLMELQLLFH